ncbi:MAG: YdiU family protein [Halioglobus sp.]|nr:YdiU family protein [Halioglobus sp.]
MAPIVFDNSFAGLPGQFYTHQTPAPASAPEAIRVNRHLATQLGIDANWLDSEAGTQVIAGNAVPPGAEPLASVYAGHQFGGYNPQLGDGRAILLGEILSLEGRRFDLQLKGSGPTPYSRGGDGRSPIGPVLREYVVSEAMHRLGVPTTRALAAATTGDKVQRDELYPGAVLARVASSHIRIGSFQYFAARRDIDSLSRLSDHVIDRHYPDARNSDNPILTMLEAIISQQAQLVARWQLLGFIHGVMNTDNVLICGETIDYGPCAFMDQFNPDQVFSSIDHAGRYAYRQQPTIAHWNLSVLAQALLPILDSQQERAVALAQTAINAFPNQFLQANTQGMAHKLGLQTIEEQDTELVEDLWQLMAEHALDFTLTFRRLADLANEASDAECNVADLFEFPDTVRPWLERWCTRLAQESTPSTERQALMYRNNPVFIPRNHLVETAIVAANGSGDLSPFNELMDILENPYQYRKALAYFATPPNPDQVVRQTFCGT